MTVSSTVTRVSYTGDGVSVNFTVTFGFYASTDLLVVQNGVTQTLATHYTVTGGLGSTGTVTMVVAPAAAVNLQIILNPPLTQTVALVDGTEFPAATLNQEADRAVQISLRLNDKLTRSLRAPDGPDVPALNDMPVATSRAGKYLAFDGTGQPTVASGTGNDSALRTDLASTTSGSDGSRLVGFRRTETGSVPESVFTLLSRQVLTPQDFGAIGNDANDDTAALLLMAAAGRDIYFPGNRIYRLTQELKWTSSPGVRAPVVIEFGAGAILKTTGVNNRALHFDGSPAGGSSMRLRLINPQIDGATSGVAPSAIYMDGIALGWIYDPDIEGNSKFTTGIEGDGWQQGGIHDGYIHNVTKCIDLYRSADEGHGTIGSNGIDIDGISLSALAAGTQIRASNCDSVQIHDTHSIGAAIGFDLVDLFLGCDVRGNHIEGPSAGPFTAAIKVSGATALSNVLDCNFLQGTGVGVWVATGKGHVVTNNKFSACGLQFDAGVEIEVLTGNTSLATITPTFTNNATKITRKGGNLTTGSGFSWRDTYSPAQITVDQDNYAIPTEATAVRASSSASKNITGLAGGWENRTIPWMNVGANDIVLKQGSVSSLAINRFEIGSDITISAGHGVVLNYDGAAFLWRCVGKY